MDPKNKRTRDMAFYVLILVILLATVFTMLPDDSSSGSYTFSDIVDLFRQERVESFVVKGDQLVLDLRDSGYGGL